MSWPVKLGMTLFLFVLSAPVGLQAQGETSLEELKDKASTAFEGKSWEKAHRAYAELLSLDGTSVHLQMRYAATLLHDDRLRDEGIQRLASLAEQRALEGEGMYWWGRSWMLQGRPEQAASAFELAVEQAGKKSSWRADCQRALDQCQSLPTQFPEVQRLKKLDVVEVPMASFHRYVQWAAEGVRLMSVPAELQSKRDKKAGIKASVALRRSSREIVFHSFGSKGEQGLDLWVATLNDKGGFDKPIRLPSQVNSPYDEVNPVWDESSQCLTFGSNRPGTLGGMDIFRSCNHSGAWTPAMPMGPSFNSVHDDLAYYPCDGEGVNGWLVTTRAGEFGAAEVWEVTLDGPPNKPLQLKSTWDMGDEALPGSLTLFDAQTDRTLAQVELQHGRGQWDLVVSSGQVIHYLYETTEGIHVEGTYALPESNGMAHVEQQMTWSPSRNELDVSTQLSPSPSEGNSSSNAIAWGWDVVLDEIPTLAAQEWSEPDVDAVAQLEVISPKNSEKRIVRFQSFPWWTELQKEERDIAASILAEHTSKRAQAWPTANEFDELSSYLSSIEEVGKDAQSEILQTIVARAAADVIMDDAPWDDALLGVLDVGAEYWEAIGWPRGELERKARRIWAEAGVRFDEGLATSVRDKRGLVGDRKWVEEPWTDGTLVGHLNNAAWSQQLEPEAAALAWSLGQQSKELSEVEGLESVEWTDARFWQVSEFSKRGNSMPSSNADAMEDESMSREMKLRLAVLDEMTASTSFDNEAIAAATSTWRVLAAPYLGKEEGERAETEESLESRTNSTFSEQEIWIAHWRQFVEGERKASQSLPSWKVEMLLWLERTTAEESRPQALLERCLSRQMSGQGPEEKSPDAGRAALVETILELCQDMASGAVEPLQVENAFNMLESTWLLSAWLHEDAWKNATLDELLLSFDNWPKLVEEAFPRMRVDWAKGRANADVNEVSEEAQSSTEVKPVGNVETGQPSQVLAKETSEILTDLNAGERGIHLGWFRNPPQVGVLPKGTRLVHEEGGQGLMRWVLLLEDPIGKELDQQALTSWLGGVGVPDAYEVQWDGSTWARPDSISASKPERIDVETEDGAEVEAIWADGGHVDLAMLDGTWHAVQVGVFAGEPDEAWLSAVGERLVKEPLSDGRAKWYVATSRDASAAKRHLEQLRTEPAFSDAFLVRLEEGFRNMVTGEDGSSPVASDPTTPVTSGVDRADGEEGDSLVFIITQRDDRRRASEGPAEVLQDAKQFPVASPEQPTSPTLWHVVIATYDSEVPANEVAAFLINSAEWGVRSVELFGLTTYFSRSFVDLKQAQQMLMKVQSDGFSQARIEALN